MSLGVECQACSRNFARRLLTFDRRLKVSILYTAIHYAHATGKCLKFFFVSLSLWECETTESIIICAFITFSCANWIADTLCVVLVKMIAFVCGAFRIAYHMNGLATNYCFRHIQQCQCDWARHAPYPIQHPSHPSQYQFTVSSTDAVKLQR